MLLQLTHIKKEYPTPTGAISNVVLQDISLEVAAGESLAIVGPSGSGKSTLLNIIGALDRPTAGKIIFNQHDFTRLSDRKLARIRNLEIGFIFQLHHLLPQCTVLENVLIPTLPTQTRGEEFQERAENLLRRVGLGDRLHYRPGQLSGGERQRTAVVRALINQPQLLLADEPTGSLDHTAAENLSRLLIELNQEQQVTLIVVTHALELAQQMSRRFLLRDGLLTDADGGTV